MSDVTLHRIHGLPFWCSKFWGVVCISFWGCSLELWNLDFGVGV